MDDVIRESGDELEDQEARIAKTESLFRDVNERIAESAERFAADEATFVCECDDPDCTERVDASLDVYEEVRADGTRFLLAPGHENKRVEQVVEKRRGYQIVRKVQRIVAQHVRRLNPRAESA